MARVIDNKKFLENLETKVYGKKLHVFEELDSTNKYTLNELENNKVEEGSCYIALRQSNGIGTSGSVWESTKPLGMWLSIVLNSPIKKQPLSFIPAIALSKMLKDCYGIDSHLKWPNDVLVGSKKISGILLQAKSFTAYNISFVVGIGVNIFQSEVDFSSDIRDKATSLQMEHNRKYSLEEIYKNYMKYFEYVYTADNYDVVAEWVKYSKMIGRIITINKDKEIIKAKVLSITNEGYMKIENVSDNKVEIIEGRAGITIDTKY